jgi:hypothetical protein
MWKIISKINKIILPSYSKKQLDLSKASKFQKIIIAYRYFVTCKVLDKK